MKGGIKEIRENKRNKVTSALSSLLANSERFRWMDYGGHLGTPLVLFHSFHFGPPNFSQYM